MSAFLALKVGFLAISSFLLCYGTVSADSPVQLFYFSREFPTEKLPLTLENQQDVVQPSKPTKIFIHGWGESADKHYYQQMMEEYLIYSDVQVVEVDWKLLASKPYLQAAENTKIVGSYVGEFILKLAEASSPEVLALIHIIGHSLGAHAAGHAGKTIRQRIGHLPARITGLDPAGPYFDLAVSARLSSNDALFVDITHTDGNYFGLDEPVGHVDFYPNGGQRPQPGCEPFNIEMLQLEPVQLWFCSHIKSYMYFIASINNQTDLALKCNSYDEYKRKACSFNEQTIYGERVDSHSVGKFYFDTSGHAILHTLNGKPPQLLNGSSIMQNLFKIIHE